MKSILINLDRSVGRLEIMTKEFSDRGLSFHRYSATDWKSLAQEVIDQYLLRCKTETSRGPFAADVALFLGHQECWKMIAKGEDDFAGIFEDDIHLSSDAAKFLTSTEWIPSDADIVKIETFGAEVKYDSSRAIDVMGRKLAPLASRHYGTGGYIISKSAAARLSNWLPDEFHTVDRLLFDPAFGLTKTLTCYQLVPALCIQDMFLPRHLQNPQLTSLIRDNDSAGSRNQDRSKGRLSRSGAKMRKSATRLFYKYLTPYTWERIPFKK